MPTNTLHRPNKLALVRRDVQAMPENQAVNMIAKETKELNDWILEHVHGWKRGRKYANGNGEWILPGSDRRITWDCAPSPTTDNAAAMMVLKEIAKKRTADGYDKYRPDATLCISAPHPDWDNEWVIMSDPCGEIIANGPTFEIAICRFAKSLFSKT